MNVLIAAVVSALVGLASTRLGIVSFVIFAGVIYVRGYLIPGTPTLTETYLPDRVLGWFDKNSTTEYASSTETGAGLDVEGVLIEIGALEERHDGDDLALTDDFQAEWQLEIERLDRSTTYEVLAEMLDVDESNISMRPWSRSFRIEVDDDEVGKWESRAAFRSDIAAGIILAERIDGWGNLTYERQTDVIRALRVFLERCPDCGGRVVMTRETEESCCRSREVLKSVCGDCEARFLELNASEFDESFLALRFNSATDVQ